MYAIERDLTVVILVFFHYSPMDGGGGEIRITMCDSIESKSQYCRTENSAGLAPSSIDPKRLLGRLMGRRYQQLSLDARLCIDEQVPVRILGDTALNRKTKFPETVRAPPLHELPRVWQQWSLT